MSATHPQPILINGEWRPSTGQSTFSAVNPATGESLPHVYPVSEWEEVERAIQAASRAFFEVQGWPGSRFAEFLEAAANEIEKRTDELVETAHLETALAKEPRLKSAELPRTTNQLRQAAAAAREGAWALPTIDAKLNIRSIMAPLGPVVVFGPNNFAYAYNGAGGGDFAAAVAAGNSVIAKGHSSHPRTTQIMAEAVQQAAVATKMPTGFFQLIYRTSHADGQRLVSHPLMGSCGYTGARKTGLVLKEAADRVGKPIYLELSSINPVAILPGALAERLPQIVEEFVGSCLMGVGQFCTNPGLLLLLNDESTNQFLKETAARFAAAPVGVLLGGGVLKNLTESVRELVAAGAEILAGGAPLPGPACRFANTLLRVSAKKFLADSERLQTESFGNSSLAVLADSPEELLAVAQKLEGNLTAGLYTSRAGSDDDLYHRLAAILRLKAGRLLNDKMPTGVAVTAAMNHGGPFPATGHPGFTAVGVPAAIRRFSMLQCFDSVRPERLPMALRDR